MLTVMWLGTLFTAPTGSPFSNSPSSELSLVVAVDDDGQ